MVLVGFIVLVISLSVLLFGLGMLANVGRAVFGNACAHVGALVTSTGVCLDLSQFNFSSGVVCGQDLANFCNSWTQVRPPI
jgi:hypothetical protein